jgi:hypothetical protein
MAIDSTDSSLLVTNQVSNLEYDGKYYPHRDAYVYYEIIGSYFNAERFSTNDLSLLGEIQAGTSVLGERGGDYAILGGSYKDDRPTLLINLTTGVTQGIDMFAYDYESMSNSAVSATLNKAFIMRVHETEPKGDMIVVNLNDLSSYQYHVADYGFNQIIVDEVGDQLILMNNEGLGLVSVSPIP